jgi:cell division protein FtsB
MNSVSESGLPKDILKLIIELASQSAELEKVKKENTLLKAENAEMMNTIDEYVNEMLVTLHFNN